MPKTKPSTLTHGECASLVRSARKATKMAYAPYSRYRVGTALLAATPPISSLRAPFAPFSLRGSSYRFSP